MKDGQARVADDRARALVSLNGHPAEDLIDPASDLAAARRDLGPADWINRGR